MSNIQGSCSMHDLQPIADEIGVAKGWDDPEVGYDVRVNPLEELEAYLDTNGVKVRENEFEKEYKGRVDIFSSYTRNLVYRIGNATIFVMHTEYITDWPRLANPEFESVRIRAYGNGKDSVLAAIKETLGLFPKLSEQ